MVLELRIMWNIGADQMYFKANELSWRGVMLVKPVDASKYELVVVEVVGTPYIMNTWATTNLAEITIGDSLDCSVLRVGSEKKDM